MMMKENQHNPIAGDLVDIVDQKGQAIGIDQPWNGEVVLFDQRHDECKDAVSENLEHVMGGRRPGQHCQVIPTGTKTGLVLWGVLRSGSEIPDHQGYPAGNAGKERPAIDKKFIIGDICRTNEPASFTDAR